MKLRVVRKEKKLTQQALAKLSGINIRRIQKIESGEILMANVTLQTALALADALGVDVRELI